MRLFARVEMMRYAFVALLAVACFTPACSCSGNGHVEQTAYFAQPGDDVVNCVCNLTFDNDHCTNGTCAAHLDVRLCLPAELQVGTPDGGAVVQQQREPLIGADPADMGPDDYSRKVDEYCRTTASQVVYHMIKVFNGGWCDYKAPYAPDGGRGNSVECFAQEIDRHTQRATTTDDGTCRTLCDPVDCDYATNCGSDVQDSTGGVHPDRCNCSVITKYGCPGDKPDELPTPLFCRPPR
jgi:hypothetical protein